MKNPLTTVVAAGILLFAAGAAWAQTSDLVERTVLRVCADPANLPFSSEDRDGFENKVAELIADRLGIPVSYEWFPQATGFVRQTLAVRKCDIIIGYAQGHELVQNTNHYYRSTYVLAHLKGGKLAGIKNLDDPRLTGSRIGVTAGTPPATVLALNGLMANTRPYPLMVDRRHEAPAQRMIDDLEAGRIDAAIMWGPIGGNLVKMSDADIVLVPLVNETRGPRMAYRITFGIRRGETDWKRQLNTLIEQNQAEINKIMLDFGVPLLDENDRLITP